MSSRSCLPVAALLTVALIACGDEAVRSDGTHIAGRLTLSETGRFQFHTVNQVEPIANLDLVRFTAKPPEPPSVPLWHQVHLAHGEVILAEFRKLDDKSAHVRPTWTDALVVPRSMIERVMHLPGWQPVLFDSFDADLGAWKKSGEPRVNGGRLKFDRAGQAVEAAIKPALTGGRVVVAFRSGATESRQVNLDLGFVRDEKLISVRIELVGPGGEFVVTAPDKPDMASKLKRAVGNRRVSVEFDKERLAVFVDEFVLRVRDAGPGELRSVKLMSEGEGTEAISVEDVLVSAAVPVAELRAWADLTADAVRSPVGDETFGTLSSVGPAGTTLDIKGRTLALAWPEVAEFAFRRGPVTEAPTPGEHVRLRIRTAEGLRDVLEGAVKGLNEKTIVLSHPVLGELTLPRDRVEEIQFQFHGRRLPVDSTPHHLGTRPEFGFAVLKPEGLRFTKSVALDNPTAGFVVIEVARVSATGTMVEVLVNGERIGDLNQFADRSEPVMRMYRLPVGASALRRGNNDIEVRLRPPASGKVNGIDVRAVRLELVDPR
jgi:hypothetical protein